MATKSLQLIRVFFLFNAVIWLQSCAYQKNSIIYEDQHPVSKTVRSDRSKFSKEISNSRYEDWWASENDVIALKSFFDPGSISGNTRQMDPASRELLHKVIDAIRKEEWQIAEATIERAIRLNPLDEYLWTQLAFIKGQRGDTLQAKIFAEKAMVLSSNNPMIQAEILNFLERLRSRGNGKK